MPRSLHPFPARMAPDLAIRELHRLMPVGTVLDPMAGSGTVVREAIERGHRALGFDVDPLAVLMARVWTTPIDDGSIDEAFAAVLRLAKRTTQAVLPWIDGDPETHGFVEYWFAETQRTALRSLAWALQTVAARNASSNDKAIDVLRLSLSRIIVTKDSGASLARDVSHSRPHRVAEQSDFDVFEGFERSVGVVRKLILDEPPPKGARVRFGDARRLGIKPQSIDLVLTSPPYLNAIDYLRGHRMSLVWLGHTLAGLRRIRAEAIGTERAPDDRRVAGHIERVRDAMASVRRLTSRHIGMVERYASDLLRAMKETCRVLRANGRAVLVVGNSCLRGVFIRNSDGVIAAAKHVGLRLVDEVERVLPDTRRYLPFGGTTDAALSKRMRTESVLSFCRA